MSDTSKEAVDGLVKDITFEAVNSEIDRILAGRIVAAIQSLAKERDELQAALEKSVAQISDLAAKLGRAEGKLEASELPGIIDGWKARAEKAEAEVERLREALGKAARALEYTHYLGDAKTARAAMQRKDENE